MRTLQSGDADVDVVSRHRIAARPSAYAERHLLPMGQGRAVGVTPAAQPSSPWNNVWLKGWVPRTQSPLGTHAFRLPSPPVPEILPSRHAPGKRSSAAKTNHVPGRAH
ncbi:hypothetical protein J155_01287 [Xanthomonas citri pv. citri]|nr:hypothetical protein J151_01289 [Xanthomonas citri subsp. citri A306]AJY81272.1 hypothetical protein J159_01286 [Xanthomonas citri pv. citri]AJY85694.1 hypothetical protein J158_01286 [Xanthomonas citri subsp. citri UI6]AJY90117.1 hypothetical protein J169_01285 [Xanthomonas citri pv. citri]AJY94588.1 hypothetical protein J164_01285 [Xanthomonas citri pv. citri]